MSLCVGTDMLPATEVLCLCSEPPAHASGATFSEWCQIRASVLSIGASIFRKWVGMEQAHGGLTCGQWGSARSLVALRILL